jgi:hypothetical protein
MALENASSRKHFCKVHSEQRVPFCRRSKGRRRSKACATGLSKIRSRSSAQLRSPFPPSTVLSRCSAKARVLPTSLARGEIQGSWRNGYAPSTRFQKLGGPCGSPGQQGAGCHRSAAVDEHQITGRSSPRSKSGSTMPKRTERPIPWDQSRPILDAVRRRYGPISVQPD